MPWAVGRVDGEAAGRPVGVLVSPPPTFGDGVAVLEGANVRPLVVDGVDTVGPPSDTDASSATGDVAAVVGGGGG